MVIATSAGVQSNFTVCRERSEGAGGAPEPVTVLHGDQPPVVILSAAGFARLKQRDKRCRATKDLPEWLIGQISVSETDPKYDCLDEHPCAPLPVPTPGPVVR